MVDWIAVSVEHGNLEIHTGDLGWGAELTTCLQSVVAGNYEEKGAQSRFTSSMTMVFGNADGDDLTYAVGGLCRAEGLSATIRRGTGITPLIGNGL